MDKVLIIAQAPPLKRQIRPMDSTMLEVWLKDAGFQYLDLYSQFDFEAIYNKFPGKTKSGGHKAPSVSEMNSYWPFLSKSLQSATRVWIMGNVALNYLLKKAPSMFEEKEIIATIHPSKRNYFKYTQQKDEIINKIKHILS